MKQNKEPNTQRDSVDRQRLNRHVYSLPIMDPEIKDFIEFRAHQHQKSRAEYLRELVASDLAKYRNDERIRQEALSKLSENERRALGLQNMPSFIKPKQGDHPDDSTENQPKQ